MLPRPIRHSLGTGRDVVLSAVFSRIAYRRLLNPRTGRHHGLPGKLIVSLTSYPPRFGALHLTLACLLDQTVEPDRIVLWIAHSDIADLPTAVRELQARGLEIRESEDLGPFKKLIPALETFPDAFIVTADDDIYYSPSWLANLVDNFDGRSITCLRADRILATSDGETAPYMDWTHNASAVAPATDLLPIGVQGVLYPPGAIRHSMNDRRFLQLCPEGDDLWYYAMASLAGTPIRKVGPVRREIMWSGSQQSALWNVNGDLGGNDRMIRAIQKEFGRLGSFYFRNSTER